MTANDQDKGKESNEKSDAERLKEIEREESKEAESYSAQADTEEETSPEDIYKPLPRIDEEKEEMSFLKTIAFLGFGLAALAIVFILFFMRDLDERVVNMDSTVAELDKKIEPFKREVTENIEKISGDITQLKGKFGDYERNMTIMELRRALITIQEVTTNTDPDVKSKSGKVVASIQALLQELTGGTSAAPAATDQPAPAAPPAEAPPTVIETPAPPAEAPPATVDAPAPEIETPAPAADTAPSDDQTSAHAEEAVEDHAPAHAEEAVEDGSHESQEHTATEEKHESESHQSKTSVGEIELSSGEEALETHGAKELIEDE